MTFVCNANDREHGMIVFHYTDNNIIAERPKHLDRISLPTRIWTRATNARPTEPTPYEPLKKMPPVRF